MAAPWAKRDIVTFKLLGIGGGDGAVVSVAANAGKWDVELAMAGDPANVGYFKDTVDNTGAGAVFQSITATRRTVPHVSGDTITVTWPGSQTEPATVEACWTNTAPVDTDTWPHWVRWLTAAGRHETWYVKNDGTSEAIARRT